MDTPTASKLRLIYQVRFANGDVESVETVRRARDQIRMRNVDSYPPQTVLPAEIRLNGDLVEVWHSFEALNAES